MRIQLTVQTGLFSHYGHRLLTSSAHSRQKQKKVIENSWPCEVYSVYVWKCNMLIVPKHYCLELRDVYLTQQPFCVPRKNDILVGNTEHFKNF